MQFSVNPPSIVAWNSLPEAGTKSEVYKLSGCGFESSCSYIIHHLLNAAFVIKSQTLYFFFKSNLSLSIDCSLCSNLFIFLTFFNFGNDSPSPLTKAEIQTMFLSYLDLKTKDVCNCLFLVLEQDWQISRASGCSSLYLT